MSNPNPPAKSGGGMRRGIWFGAIVLALYAVFLGRHFSPFAGGADSSGYLNSARLLAAGALQMEARLPPGFVPGEWTVPQHFQPHGFVCFRGDSWFSPTYPVGLPLHLAVAGRMFGWDAAPVVVGIGAALAALGLMYAVGRQFGLPPVMAAAGGVLLAVYPVFLFTSLQPLSDTPATAWCLAAVWAAGRARERPGWAVACGGALAVAVLVRATNLLVLPALVALLGRDWRRLGLAVLGGLPGALWLGTYQHALYGSAFRSGYVDISAAFAWSHGWPTARHFLHWLAWLLPAVLLVLPAAAARRLSGRRRELGVLALWFVPFALFYSFYEISHEVWWNLRFLLPGTPGLLLAALLGLEELIRSRPPVAGARWRVVSVAALTVWATVLGAYWAGRFHLRLLHTYEAAYAEAATQAKRSFPDGTPVVAGLHSGALVYYTQLPVLRWEFFRPDAFARARAQAGSAGRPIGAVLHKAEREDALERHCPGNWIQVATVRDFSLWRLEPEPPTPMR